MFLTHKPITLRFIISAFCATLLLCTTFCRAGLAATKGNFEASITQGRNCEQSDRTLEALIYYSEALRLNPSSDLQNKRAALFHKVMAQQKLASSSGNAQDDRDIRLFFQDFVNCWNNHNVSQLGRLLSPEFFTSDGLDYRQILEIARFTWQTYPTSKAYFEVKNAKISGDYAEVETEARIVGAMNWPNVGNMRSTIHDVFALRKTDKGWKITGQYPFEESVVISIGQMQQIDAHLNAPHTVAPGEQFDTTLDALLPAGTTATVGIVQTTPSWPVIDPTFNWVQMSGTSLRNQFTANRLGKNEDVCARINLSNGFTGQQLGALLLSKRVNIVDAPTQIVSAPQNISPTRTMPPAQVHFPAPTPSTETQTPSTPTTIASVSKSDAAAAVKANKPVRDKWAIIVGISEFQDPKIPKLQYSAKDAIDFYKFLEKSGNFRRDHMRLLLNEKATQRRILTELATLFLHRVAEPDDLVVVFFSTHGSPTEEGPGGNNYLVAYDTSVDELFASGVSMQAIMSTLKERINSDRILLVLDACHSGATTVGAKGMSRSANFDAETIAQGSGQLVICSSEPSERSWESKRTANGVFTKKLIEGLSKNGTQTTLGEAFQYLQSQVAKEVKEDRGATQNPVLRSKWNGAQLLPLLQPAQPQPVPATLLQQLPADSSSEVK